MFIKFESEIQLKKNLAMAEHEEVVGAEVKNEGEEKPEILEGNEGEHVEEDQELVDLKRQVQQMQAEAERLEEIQKEVEAQMSTGQDPGSNGQAVDSRSVYVGNVDYAVTPEELQAHFQSCGTINRVTILCDKFTGHPKGYAYIEFAEEEGVTNALVLNETLVHNRQIKVLPKRTNVPGFNRGALRSRYRGYYRGGFRGRSRRAFYHPYM
jgi:polyadenylate-binding protein 2